MNPPLDQFTIKDLKSIAPAAKEKEISTGRSETEAFVHCEVALAIAMQAMMQDNKLEIGVSKDCCWPCLTFLAEYSSRLDKNIVVSATRGKSHHNWLFPSNVSPDIYNRLETTARRELQAWIVALNRRRTSDSHAASSSDECSQELETEQILAEMGRRRRRT